MSLALNKSNITPPCNQNPNYSFNPKQTVHFVTALKLCFCSKVDPGNTGRVGPTEAALFLKKSGLPDITLGRVSGKCSPRHECVIYLTLHLSYFIWFNLLYYYILNIVFVNIFWSVVCKWNFKMCVEVLFFIFLKRSIVSLNIWSRFQSTSPPVSLSIIWHGQTHWVPCLFSLGVEFPLKVKE